MSYNGLKLAILQEELKAADTKILKLKGLLRRAQTQLDYAILATPTGERREELTQLNIEMQAELEDI